MRVTTSMMMSRSSSRPLFSVVPRTIVMPTPTQKASRSAVMMSKGGGISMLKNDDSDSSEGSLSAPPSWVSSASSDGNSAIEVPKAMRPAQMVEP